MVSTPPARRRSPRRHRSRSREAILAWLRATESHPTAAEIHGALHPEHSGLSLGTVYRNLEVLVADGQVDAVPAAVGPTRFDGNVEPHHHFHCERCGRILDVDLPRPRGLMRRLRGERGLEARRVRVDFFGLCGSCEAERERACGAGADRRAPERSARS